MIKETAGQWYSDIECKWYEEKAIEHLAHVVYEEEDKPVFSGLYNHNGEKLYKIKPKKKIGFW